MQIASLAIGHIIEDIRHLASQLRIWSSEHTCRYVNYGPHTLARHAQFLKDEVIQLEGIPGKILHLLPIVTILGYSIFTDSLFFFFFFASSIFLLKMISRLLALLCLD